ncbi:MAG: nitroreductase family protein [Chloroflexi bacterium]|nr:nitroreductase family protein [Chloroflexota bacterium]
MNSQILEIIRYATLAPSGHNTQPWKFAIKDNTIRILPDFARHLAIVDPDDRELFISLGCALENLVIAAQQMGYADETALFPANDPDAIVVRLNESKTKSDSHLFDAIPIRQSTRNEYAKQKIPTDDLQKLEQASQAPCISALLFTENQPIESFIEYVKEGNRQQYADKHFVEELIQWLRFNDDEALQRRDGLSTRCSGNPSTPRWLGSFFVGGSNGDDQTEKDAKNIRSSAGMMLFVSERNDKAAWVETGRAYERYALTATTLNIKSAFLNQPIEVPTLRSQLQTRFNLAGAYPQLLLRFGYSQVMPRSLRRPIEAVIGRG